MDSSTQNAQSSSDSITLNGRPVAKGPPWRRTYEILVARAKQGGHYSIQMLMADTGYKRPTILKHLSLLMRLEAVSFSHGMYEVSLDPDKLWQAGIE